MHWCLIVPSRKNNHRKVIRWKSFGINRRSHIEVNIEKLKSWTQMCIMGYELNISANLLCSVRVWGLGRQTPFEKSSIRKLNFHSLTKRPIVPFWPELSGEHSCVLLGCIITSTNTGTIKMFPIYQAFADNSWLRNHDLSTNHDSSYRCPLLAEKLNMIAEMLTYNGSTFDAIACIVVGSRYWW